MSFDFPTLNPAPGGPGALASNVPTRSGSGEPLNLGDLARPVTGVASDVLRGNFSSKYEVREAMGKALFLDRPASDEEVVGVFGQLGSEIRSVLGTGATSLFDQAEQAYQALPEGGEVLWGPGAPASGPLW